MTADPRKYLFSPIFWERINSLVEEFELPQFAYTHHPPAPDQERLFDQRASGGFQYTWKSWRDNTEIVWTPAPILYIYCDCGRAIRITNPYTWSWRTCPKCDTVWMPQNPKLPNWEMISRAQRHRSFRRAVQRYNQVLE